MTFQFPSNVSVSVRATLCALCIAIAQVMRRALSMSPPMPMYLTVRVVYSIAIAQVAIDRFDPPPPLSSTSVCACVLPGSKVTGVGSRSRHLRALLRVCKSKSLLTYTG